MSDPCAVCDFEGDSYCEFCPYIIEDSRYISNRDPGDECDARPRPTLPLFDSGNPDLANQIRVERRDNEHRIRFANDAFRCEPDESAGLADQVNEIFASPPPVDWTKDAVIITHRSYKATYQIGDVFNTRTIIGFDSFPASAALAFAMRREGETLIGLTELI